MQYIVNLSDQQRQHMVVFTVRETDVKRSAVDFFFDIVSTNPPDLAEDGIIPHGQVEELSELQQLIFAEDASGVFIRDEVMISANGSPLNPDDPFKTAFTQAQGETAYMHCDLVVATVGLPAATKSGATDGAAQKIDDLARIWFLWQIGNNYAIDVTKDHIELADSIAEAEKRGWIEIDVQRAAYKLTEAGQRILQTYKDEAQDLIKRYDIYGDTDVDYDGNVRFDTGLGKDLRIPMFEMDGLDPYRARFLIGMNDGEWNSMSDWPDRYKLQQTYETILGDVAYAPSIEDIGRDTLERISSAGKSQLRMDSRLS